MTKEEPSFDGKGKVLVIEPEPGRKYFIGNICYGKGFSQGTNHNQGKHKKTNPAKVFFFLLCVLALVGLSFLLILSFLLMFTMYPEISQARFEYEDIYWLVMVVIFFLWVLLVI